MPTSPTRRAVLAALSASAAAGLAGCATPWGRLRLQPLGGDPSPTPGPPDPDELARRAAVSAVVAVLVQLGGLDASLAGPLRAALDEQLVALGATAPTTAPTSTSTSTSTARTTTTTSSPSASAATSTAPPSAQPSAQQVAGLLEDAAETASADLAAVAGGTARMLACLAAGLDAAAGWTRESLGRQAAPGGSPAPSSSPSSSPSTSPSSSAAASPLASSAGPGTRASASPTAAAASGEQEALVAALGVEEAAEYGYGVVAARLAGAQRDTAVRDLASHTDLVELLRDDLLAQGAAPPAPAPAWALPSPVTGAAAALDLAQRLEGASAAAWADVVAASDRERRAPAAAQLRLAALRWQEWRSAASAPGLVALPGLSGR